MGNPRNEPTSWKNFDDSPLSVLLRHDSWTPETAIPLICDIDTKQSELFNDAMYYNTSFIEKEYREEPLTFWKIRLLSDLRNNCPRCWYKSVDDYSAACDDWVNLHQNWYPNDPFVSLEKTLSGQHRAQNLLKDLWEMYFSNSDHVKTPVRSPNFFIAWAKGKGIEIPWLDWAVARGFIGDPSRIADEAAISNSRPQAVSQREKMTYLNIIGGLVHLMLGSTQLGKPNSEFRDQSAIIAALEYKFPSAPGIKKRTLEGKFSDAKKSINQY